MHTQRQLMLRQFHLVVVDFARRRLRNCAAVDRVPHGDQHSIMSKDQPRTPLRNNDAMQGASLGPEFSQTEVEQRLRAAGATFSVLSDDKHLDEAARELADGRALGWLHGRMDFGSAPSARAPSPAIRALPPCSLC